MTNKEYLLRRWRSLSAEHKEMLKLSPLERKLLLGMWLNQHQQEEDDAKQSRKA